MLSLLLLGCSTLSGPDALPVDLVHRPTADACPEERPAGPDADALCSTGEGDLCASHADCGDGANGRCVLGPVFDQCECRYDECVTDADCGGTAVCGCAGVAPHEDQVVNRCMKADCRVDADCESGLCLSDRWACGSQDSADDLHDWEFYCATDEDTCRSDATCTAPGDFCVFDGAAWTCSNEYSITCE